MTGKVRFITQFKMFSQGAIWCIFSLVGAVTAQSLIPWNDLRVTYNPDRTQGYHQVPMTLRSPMISDYIQVPTDWEYPARLFCYRPNDPRVCLMFDFNGNVAGIQISYLANDTIARQGYLPYDYSRQPIFTRTNTFNIPAWSIRVWFTNPETLTPAGRTDLSQSIEGLWMYLDQGLVRVDRQEPTTSPIKGFYRQNCWDGMGQHYFYHMDRSVPCDRLEPIYMLYRDHQLVGFGVTGFALGSQQRRMWYEIPPLPIVDAIVVNRPACMDSWVERYSFTTAHVYFISDPWATTCYNATNQVP